MRPASTTRTAIFKKVIGIVCRTFGIVTECSFSIECGKKLECIYFNDVTIAMYKACILL
jgi:hypothetical protein